jgi:hypothetical protein
MVCIVNHALGYGLTRYFLFPTYSQAITVIKSIHFVFEEAPLEKYTSRKTIHNARTLLSTLKQENTTIVPARTLLLGSWQEITRRLTRLLTLCRRPGNVSLLFLTAIPGM